MVSDDRRSAQQDLGEVPLVDLRATLLNCVGHESTTGSSRRLAASSKWNVIGGFELPASLLAVAVGVEGAERNLFAAR